MLAAPVIEPETSDSIARNSDHYTTEMECNVTTFESFPDY
jgi:hypothetical protein